MSTAHKYLQRIISAVLILVMVFGLVGNVPARAEDAEENNLILAESFETSENGSFIINDNLGIKSTHIQATVDGTPGNGIVTWNGANPIAGSGISTYLSGGSVTLNAGVSGAYHGDSCIEHIANQYTNESGKVVYASRIYITYTLNAAQTAKMIDGATYVAGIWVKQSSEDAGRITLSVLNSGTNSATAQTVQSEKTTQWQQIKVDFTYDSSKPVKIQIATSNPSANVDGTGIYLDYLTVEKRNEVADAVAICDTATVPVGRTVTLIASYPEGKSVAWTSSNESVAAVNNGVVTGVSEGTAVITATVGTASDTCTVSVTSADAYIVNERFENPVVNDNSGIISTSGNAVWNLASHANWSMWVNKASVLLEGMTDTAYEGNNAIKVTPGETGGRGTALYTLTAAEMNKLEIGTEYKISVWVKAAGGTLSNFGLELKNATSSAPTIKTVDVGTEWVEVSHSFVLETKEKSIQIGVGPKGVVTNAYYIDKLTLSPSSKATEIALNATEAYLEPGQSTKLNYSLSPLSAVSDVVFKSSNPAVAVVAEDGTVTACSVGETSITATAVNGRVKASCVIHVVDEYVELINISLNETSVAMTPGAERNMAVVLYPANATVSTTAWSSSNDAVVRVDKNGMLTAIANGTAVITAAVKDKTASCTVTVAEDASFAGQTKNVGVNFGKTSEIDLKSTLAADTYKVTVAPNKGNAYISGDKLYYTSNTWLMDQDGEFIDQEYQDIVIISAKRSGGKSATITLNITVGKLADLMAQVENWSLLFTQADLDSIKAEAKTNADRKKLIDQALAEADSLVNKIPAEYKNPQTGIPSYDEYQRETGDVAVAFMMAYLFTKNDANYAEKNALYLQKTIQWLKASLSYPFWGSTPAQNNDLACAHQLFAVAMAYCWLKDELANERCDHTMGTDNDLWDVTTENVPILEAIEKRMWQAGSDLYKESINYKVYVMNHLNIRMAGLMAAAVALQSDSNTPTQKNTLVKWMGMGLYKDGYGMNALMPDGTSQEGLPYWEYGTTWVFKGAYVAKTALGIDLIDMTNVYSQSADYVLYNGLPMNEWTSSQNLLNIGDSPTYHYDGPSHILRMIAAEYQDETAQWLAETYEAKHIGLDEHVWMSAVFGDVSVGIAEPENLETLKWFKDLNHVVSRSDFSGNEDILSIKTGVPCGENLLRMVQSGAYVGEADAGHAHPDANHITLYSNGEYLLRDDGYSDKYASNHNTLLVNGEGQLGSGNEWMQEQPYIDNNAVPHMNTVKEVVDTDNDVVYDYIVGDATEAYASELGLDLFQRHIVYLKQEKVLLVVDNIETMEDTDLELRWFTGSKAALLSGGIYTIESNSNTMNFFPFGAENVSTTFENVVLYGRAGATSEEKTFRQTYTGSSWQNAVAFSWNQNTAEAAYVKYKHGENANEHIFGVNGKVYTVNVLTNTVTIAEGDFETSGGGASDNSSISTLMINGNVYDAFSGETHEYMIDRWWKDYDLSIVASASAYGAEVTVDQSDMENIKITCVSRDRTSTTVYTLRITNTNKILGIKRGWTNVFREGCDISNSWDNFVAVQNEPTYWTVQAPESGKVYANYDLGELVTLEQLDIVFHNSSLRDTYYDVNISTDGENWTSFVEDVVCAKTTPVHTGGNHGWATILENQAIQTRYVQIVLRGHTNTDNKDKAGVWNGIMEITFRGNPEERPAVGSVRGVKVNEQGKPVHGAVIGLFAKDTVEFTPDTALRTVLSDENGLFSFENVEFGSYLVRELDPSVGYVLSNKTDEVEISKDSHDIDLGSIESRHITGVLEIIVSDASDGKFLTNVGIRIFDADTQTVAEGYSDKNGQIVISLRYGEYTCGVISAPDGYLLDTALYAFTITEDGQTVKASCSLEQIREKQETPKTGDEFSFVYWIGLCGAVLSGIALYVILHFLRREREL